MGGRFWLGLLGYLALIGLGALILFLLVADAFVKWGVLGALIFFGGVALLIGWIFDRRRQAEYDEA